MTTFTIEAKSFNLTVKDGKLKGARLEWCAAGVEFYLKGSFKGNLYEVAANLAMNKCLSMNIPAISLRRAKKFNGR